MLRGCKICKGQNIAAIPQVKERIRRGGDERRTATDVMAAGEGIETMLSLRSTPQWVKSAEIAVAVESPFIPQ